MAKREEIVLEVSKVCGALKRGEISIKDMPLDAVLDMTAQAYNDAGYNGIEYPSIYGNLMISCIEKCDIEALVNVIELALRDILILPMIKENENILNLRVSSLQSKIGHYRNKEKVRKWHRNHQEEHAVPFMGKGVIYSAITGGYDDVKEPEYINPDLDYILFTDNPNVKSNVWEIRLISKEENLDDTRMVRKIKILGHQYLKDYDFSIWVDGSLLIKNDLYDFILNYREREPLLCFSNSENDCIYQEKEQYKILNKDDPDTMDVQIERYRKEGYPEHNGLIDSGVLVRELKNERVIKVMETWWQEVLHGSKRDQLSFSYACWKNDFVYDTTDLYIYGNSYVGGCKHN